MKIQRSRIGRLVAGAILTAAIGGPLVAAAPDIIKTRIAGFHELGTAYKNVNDQLKTDSPSMMVVQIQAREIQKYAGQIKNWFPAGSGQKPGVKTAAKPEIWKQAKQFKAASDDLIAKADAFAATTRGSDVAAMQAAGKALGATCGSCHRAFRADSKG